MLLRDRIIVFEWDWLVIFGVCCKLGYKSWGVIGVCFVIGISNM